jgi:hypothetical protein
MALIQKSVKKGNVNSNRNENAIVDDVTDVINTVSNYYELLSYSTNSARVSITNYVLYPPTRFVGLAFQIPALNLNKLYTYYIDKYTTGSITTEGDLTNVVINNENVSSLYIGNFNGYPVNATFNGKYFDQINFGYASSFNAPNLVAANNLNSSTNYSFPIYLPSLKFISGYLSIPASVPSFFCPALEAVTDFYAQYTYALTEVNVPSLKYVSNFSLNQNSSLTSVNISSLEYIGGSFVIQANGSFAMALPESVKGIGGTYIYMDGMNQAQVDATLVKLASLDGTNGTLILKNSFINLPAAPPSPVGIAAKDILISRGCTVLTN